MPKRTPTLEQIEAATKRWRTRFRRALTELTKLEAQRKRMTKKARAMPVTMIAIAGPAGPVSPPVYPTVDSEGTVASDVSPTTLGALPPGPKPTTDDLAIPAFLQRTKPDRCVDHGAAIAAEIEAKRKAKARGRIEKMKAKKAGDTKKMPLSGKAALDMIRNG